MDKTKKQGRRERGKGRQEGRRERGNVGLKANEVTLDHLEEEYIILEILELEETMESMCYLHCLPPPFI